MRPTILPGSPRDRTRIKERGRFHATRLEPVLRAPFPGRAAPGTDLLQRSSEQISVLLEQLDRVLREENGMVLTLGDCGHMVTLARIEALDKRMALEVSWPMPVLAYRDRLWSLAAVEEEMSD